MFSIYFENSDTRLRLVVWKPEMNANLNYEVRAAAAVGRAVALEAGRSPHSAASAEVEAKLSRLLAVTAGMFVFALASVAAVGLWLF